MLLLLVASNEALESHNCEESDSDDHPTQLAAAAKNLIEMLSRKLLNPLKASA